MPVRCAPWYAARSLIVALALGSACTSGAPPGFAGGKGDRWSMPLIGPLEDGLLLVPVSIDGHGPYVFAIDPDATVTAVDEQVIKEGSFRTAQGPRQLDENDSQQVRFYAELAGIELGSLIVERRTTMIVKRGTFDREGRRIHGILGRDLLPDSLVFGFDRDQGLAHLVVKKSFQPPADAIEIPYQLVPSRLPNIDVQPSSRRLVTATINGQAFAMHVDLGTQLSTLRESLWERAGLTPEPVRGGQIDEVGIPHKIEKVGRGQSVGLANLSAPKLAFAPYEDKRWADTDVAGTLALDFLRDYNVWVDWDGKRMWLVKRTPQTLATRLSRWETGALGKCPHEGCVQIRSIDPTAGKELAPGAVHPGIVLSVTRDESAGGMELEILLEAVGRPDLPRVVVNMSPNGERAMEHLKPEWAGLTMKVLDAAPFARECPQGTTCVDLIAR